MIGIRREDKNDWERRTPLTPRHAATLLAERGVGTVVQPSPLRAFPDGDYTAVGARVDESLDACNTILGIKEVPVDALIAGKAYVFFSHTTKGQAHNMPLLRAILDRRITLLDYERIVDPSGRRLVFFGRHAGSAGMIDSLWALGRRLERRGRPNPFAAIEPAHRYDSLAAAEAEIARVGEEIGRTGVPAGLHPLVFGFTGTGNVSRGAQEVFDELPVCSVAPEELSGLTEASDRHVVYKTVFDLADRFVHKSGGAVTIDALSREPEQFDNGMLRYLRHLTVLVNGMFWVPALPRLLGLDDLRQGWGSGELAGLELIADISCDVGGAIEANVRATAPDAPVYVYDLTHERAIDGVEGNGPVILAVDILPAELPRESSEAFGDSLLAFVEPLARCDWNRPLEQLALPAELGPAVIAHRGRLAPAFDYLERHLSESGA